MGLASLKVKSRKAKTTPLFKREKIRAVPTETPMLRIEDEEVLWNLVARAHPEQVGRLRDGLLSVIVSSAVKCVNLQRQDLESARVAVTCLSSLFVRSVSPPVGL
jgi:hypothetical protein